MKYKNIQYFWIQWHSIMVIIFHKKDFSWKNWTLILENRYKTLFLRLGAWIFYIYVKYLLEQIFCRRVQSSLHFWASFIIATISMVFWISHISIKAHFKQRLYIALQFCLSFWVPTTGSLTLSCIKEKAIILTLMGFSCQNIVFQVFLHVEIYENVKQTSLT